MIHTHKQQNTNHHQPQPFSYNNPQPTKRQRLNSNPNNSFLQLQPLTHSSSHNTILPFIPLTNPLIFNPDNNKTIPPAVTLPTHALQSSPMKLSELQLNTNDKIFTNMYRRKAGRPRKNSLKKEIMRSDSTSFSSSSSSSSSSNILTMNSMSNTNVNFGNIINVVNLNETNRKSAAVNIVDRVINSKNKESDKKKKVSSTLMANKKCKHYYADQQWRIDRNRRKQSECYRELTKFRKRHNGKLPSLRAMMKLLRVGFPKAHEILDGYAKILNTTVNECTLCCMYIFNCE